MSNPFSNSTMAKLRRRLSSISSELQKSNEGGITRATSSLIQLEGELFRDESSRLEKTILLYVTIARSSLATGQIDKAQESVEKAFELAAAGEKAE